MGWSTKHDVSVNGGVDWSQILLQPGAAAEPEKPPSMRRQLQPEFLKCPRCGSTNTKFCYYNNYNKTQPRYFCKACRRHWTKGGTFRNVPVGGGRKSKRPKKTTSATPVSSFTTSAAAAAAVTQHQDCPNFPFNSTVNLDQKIMCSSTLYHNLSRSSSDPLLRDIQKTSLVDENGTNNTINVSASQIENTSQCPFSSLGIFDLNSCLNVCQDYDWNLDSTAEASINPAMSSVQQWQTVESCSDNMVLANDWNWNEIDELVSPDQFKYIMDNDRTEIEL